jgi:hypothetical protein
VPSSKFKGSNFTIPYTDLSGKSFVGMYVKIKRLHNNVADVESNVFGPIQPNNNVTTILISGTPKVGAKFTATSSGSDFSGNFDWYYASDADGGAWGRYWINIGEEHLSGANRSEFTVPDGLLGQYIHATRTNHMTGGTASSNVIGPIKPADE